MKKVAAGSIVYTLGTDTCFGVGIIWSDEELDDALEHRVYDLFFDVEHQEETPKMLSDMIETDLQRDNLNKILSYQYDDAVKESEVGEVLAEAYLTDHRNCYFPWPIRDDKRTDKASLPGVDLVGFKTDDRGDIFAFGEVKTSTQKYPSGVMQGKKGLTQQLKNLRDCKKPQEKLIFSYLLKRVKNSSCWFKRYQMAAARYLKSDTDIHLYGILIRDVTPCKTDLKSCVEKLNDGCPKDTQIELLALNLPKGGIKRLATTLVEKRARGRS